MAVVNPPVPNPGDPNYQQWSRGVGNVHTDQSMKSLFEGLGTSLHTTSTIADTLVKQHLEDSIYTTAEAERDKYIRDLEATRAALRPNTQVAHQATAVAPPLSGQAIPFPTAGGVNWPPAGEHNVPETTATGLAESPGIPSGVDPNVITQPDPRTVSLIPTQGRQLPQSLQDLPQTLSETQGGLDTGRLSRTEFDGRMANIAKEYRGNFPGYRQYIDQQFEKILGVDPANSYVNHITQDINQVITRSRQDREHILAHFRTNNDIEGASEISSLYRRGVISEDAAMGWMNRQLSVRRAQTDLHQRMVNENLSRDQQRRAATDLATNVTSGMVYRQFDTMLTSANINGQRAGELLSDVQEGRVTANEQNSLAMGQAVSGMRQRAHQELLAWANRRDSTGQTPAQRIGSAETQTIINNALAPYDSILTGLRDKDFSPLFGQTNVMRAFFADEQRRLLGSTDRLPTYLAGMDLFTKHAGPASAALMTTQYLARNQIPDPFNTAVFGQQIQIGLGTANPFLRPGQQPVTLNQAIGQVAADADRSQQPPRVKALAFGEVFRAVDQIADPTTRPELRTTLVNAMTGELGLLARFDRDVVNRDGRNIPGRDTLWQRLTSRPVAQAIFQQSVKTGDPGLWTRYVTWVEHSHTNEMFREDIANLNSFRAMRGFSASWDTDAMRWRYNFSSPSRTMGDRSDTASMSQYDVLQAREGIERINQSLSAFRNIQELGARGSGDAIYVNTYLYEQFNRLGINFTTRPQSIPEHLATSVAGDKVRPTTTTPTPTPAPAPVVPVTPIDSSPTLKPTTDNAGTTLLRSIGVGDNKRNTGRK